LRPPVVALRARKPILRARFLRWGRNVGCMIVSKKEGQGDRSRSGVSRTGLAVFRGFGQPPASLCSGLSVSLLRHSPTGEPDAGDPPVRFGGHPDAATIGQMRPVAGVAQAANSRANN
jgi:hypothetical protein